VFSYFKKKTLLFLDQKRITKAFLFINLVFFFLGFFTLIGLSEYNGSKPINIFLFLGIIVFMPFIIFVITFLMSSLSSERSLLEKVLLYFFKKLGGLEEKLTTKSFQKEVCLNGIYYSLGALLALILKITFSDVLFGWTSSLNISSQIVYQFFEFLSWPWKFIFKEGRITQELIEASEYFRSNKQFIRGDYSIEDLRYMSSWWQYLSYSIIFYGILPRFIIWIGISFREDNHKKTDTVESYFQFSYEHLNSLFELNSKELFFYHSILYRIILNDIDLEQNISEKNKKLKWLDKWQGIIFNREPSSRGDLIDLINKEGPHNIKLLILLCEASCFRPYYQFDEEIEIEHFNFNESVLMLEKMASYTFSNYKEIGRFSARINDNLRLLDSSELKKWIGVAFFSAGAIALTGGIGIGIGAALAKLGIASVSIKASGLALMGGGVLLLDRDNQDYKIFLGCGALFSALADDGKFSESYFSEKETLRNDLVKLVTFYQFSFFTQNNNSYNQDFSYYLSQIRSKSKAASQLVDKLERKILT